MKKENITIDGVAIQYSDTYIKPFILVSLPSPHRHHELFALLGKDSDLKYPHINMIQGFYTNHGNFLNREEAKKLAMQNNQLKKQTPFPELYSEDLW